MFISSTIVRKPPWTKYLQERLLVCSFAALCILAYTCVSLPWSTGYKLFRSRWECKNIAWLYCVDASRMTMKELVWLSASSMAYSCYRSPPAGRAVVCERCEDGWGDGEGHPTGLRTLQPRLWTSLQVILTCFKSWKQDGSRLIIRELKVRKSAKCSARKFARYSISVSCWTKPASLILIILVLLMIERGLKVKTLIPSN